MSMIETADIVAQRYGITREAQDRFSVESQRKTEEAQLAGRYRDEIVACDDHDGSHRQGDQGGDQARRHGRCRYLQPPGTTYEALAKLEPVKGQDKFITAGNSSQLSDGASACVLMEAKEAARAGIKPLGAFRGLAVAGCEPDEMGIGPVFAVPKLLARHGLKVEDIGLWELNEAFASQAIYCRDRSGIPDERLNVDGGAISIGHPVRHDRRAAGGPRADRRQAPRREIRGRHDVHRRWHGRRRFVRNLLRSDSYGPEIHT